MKRVLIGLIIVAVGRAFTQPVSAAEETVLYSFCGQYKCADGAGPTHDLIDVDGTLYGTTRVGGLRNKKICGYGCGTVFSLDPTTGTEVVLYSFTGAADGYFPDGGLVLVNGTLYGTTTYAGSGSYCVEGDPCGTAFSIDPTTSAETTLYSFCSQPNCTDGSFPSGDLLNVNGTLYGTAAANAYAGGPGNVFSIDPVTGAENVVYAFGSCLPESGPRSFRGCEDGATPYDGLIDVNGILYGTTSGGGRKTKRSCFFGRCGTAFSLDLTTGTETVLYSFCRRKYCKDGATPQTALIDVNGTLYGTTFEGGNRRCDGLGCGTVFSVDPATGTETVLYQFCSKKTCKDGSGPETALINVNGTLYGTTGGGGKAGYGTVYSFDPTTGTETVLYAFCSQTNCADGSIPEGRLTSVNGVLYGTTAIGGANNGGTVFEITP